MSNKYNSNRYKGNYPPSRPQQAQPATARTTDMKPVIIDANTVTMRRVAQFRREMNETNLIADDVEKMERQAAILAEMTENWSTDDILDLPVSKFNEVSSAIANALKGVVPNGNATS